MLSSTCNCMLLRRPLGLVFYLYSEEESKIAARKFARKLQCLGYTVRFCNFRIVNVLGTCSMPFRIKIASFSQKHPKDARYENLLITCTLL